MSIRGGVLDAPGDVQAEERERAPDRLPLRTYVLGMGTLLMGTTEFLVAGLMPQIAGDLGTASGSWTAGLALDSALGATGPAAVGTAVAALALIPAVAIALTQRRCGGVRPIGPWGRRHRIRANR